MARLAAAYIEEVRAVDAAAAGRLVPIDATGAGVHISLSRPFALRLHQIEPFVESLRARLRLRARCVRPRARARELPAPGTVFVCRMGITLYGGKVFVNDDRSRTFLAATVRAGADMVSACVRGHPDGRCMPLRNVCWGGGARWQP